MKSKEEQLRECTEARMREHIKPYPNQETLHNLNLRELALILGDIR